MVRARISSHKLLGMSTYDCNWCHVNFSSQIALMQHFVADAHNFVVLEETTRLKICWCLYCAIPLKESVADHIVTPFHVARLHEAIFPEVYYPYVIPQPCAPTEWFVMRQGVVQREQTPELTSQILPLHVEAMYARHKAMHPYADFSDDDSDVEEVS